MTAEPRSLDTEDEPLHGPWSVWKRDVAGASVLIEGDLPRWPKSG